MSIQHKEREITKCLLSVTMILFIVLSMGTYSVKAADVTVNNTAELKSAMTLVEDGDVITLDPSFVGGKVTINVPNKDVKINGNGITWGNGMLTINGSGKLTVDNVIFDGTNHSDRLVEIENYNGNVTLDNIEMLNTKKGALYTELRNGKFTLNNSNLHNNTGMNTASVLRIEADTNVEINNTTIKDNVGEGSGYECGAIASKQYNSTLTINNTIMENNVNKCEKSGVLGGGGGAISMHYLMATSHLNINESYFKGNKTNGDDNNVESTFDGGAIYLFDLRDGATFNVDRTTFDSNIAYDDGGAILVQSSGTSAVTKANITNSTFYNNKAYGMDGAGASGGAIQFFKNGNSSKVENNVVSSTFVNNQGGYEKSNNNQNGGAIGLSGSGGFLTAIAPLNTTNSLYIGNRVFNSGGIENKDSNFKDISGTGILGSTATPTDKGSKNVVSVDKGSNPELTMKDVLGTKTPELSENHSSIKAGKEQMIVPTIPIKPEGVADGTYTSSNTIPVSDQRGYTRDKDNGAVEMAWIKYDANGSNFNLDIQNKYLGNEFYDKKDPIEYYQIGKNGLDEKIITAESKNLVTPNKKIFKGWSTDKDASVGDPNYAPGTILELPKDNLVLYAIWENEIDKYTLTYDKNGAQTGTQPIDVNSPYNDGSDAIVMDQGDLSKDGYSFDGWNTSADGKGTPISVGSTIKVDKDIVLYAQWKKDVEKFTITYDSNNATSGDVPIDSNNPYIAGTNAIVLDNTNLLKDGHTFDGWNTKADGKGTSYSVGSSVVIDKNIILYAQWKKDAEKYTITYDANGATSGSVPVDANNPYVAGSIVKVMDKGDLLKTDHKFMGWNTSADGSGTPYVIGSDLAIDKNIVLYAIWNKEDTKYSLIYDKNGATSGNVPVDANSPYIVGSNAIVLDNSNLIKTGYSFNGWNTASNGSGISYVVGDSFAISKDTKLYAQWKKDTQKHSIRYNGNGSTSGKAPVDSKSPYISGSSAKVLNKNSLVKKGYSFVEWNTKADGKGKSYKVGSSIVINKNIVLYAQWKKESVIINHEFYIIYKGNGNTSGSAPIDKNNPYKNGEKATILDKNDLKRKNYKFLGWNTRADGKGKLYKPGSKYSFNNVKNNEAKGTDKHNVVLYAQWKNLPDTGNNTIVLASILVGLALSTGIMYRKIK